MPIWPLPAAPPWHPWTSFSRWSHKAEKSTPKRTEYYLNDYSSKPTQIIYYSQLKIANHPVGMLQLTAERHKSKAKKKKKISSQAAAKWVAQTENFETRTPTALNRGHQLPGRYITQGSHWSFRWIGQHPRRLYHLLYLSPCLPWQWHNAY